MKIKEISIENGAYPDRLREIDNPPKKLYVLGNENIQVASIWMSIVTGIFGIVLQWTFLPLIVYRVENLKKFEE